MAVFTTNAHEERVSELKLSLTAEGYSIEKPGTLPNLPFEPDLVARRGEEILVVEVTGWHESDRKRRLSSMAEAIRLIPHARFKIASLLPPIRTFYPETVYSYSRDEYAQRISEGHDLLEKQHAEAALLILWATVEGIMRDEAERLDPGMPLKRSPAELIEIALSLGIVEEDEEDTLRRALQARNVYAHGFRLDAESEGMFGDVVKDLHGICLRMLIAE